MHRSLIIIQEAIYKLENNLLTCVPYCCFGVDNKKKIIAMIDVLKNNRSTLWINSNFLSPSELMHELPDNLIWQSAMDAREWLDGSFDVEDLLFKNIDSVKYSLLANLMVNQ